jgi:hypothetical protein
VTLFENSLKGEVVKGVKMVAEEAVVAVVAGVLIGPGVHTSCSNDRFELTREYQWQSVKSGGAAHWIVIGGGRFLCRTLIVGGIVLHSIAAEDFRLRF